MNESFWDKFSKTTKVDCIEMKDQAQERVTQQTRGMSPDQLLAFLREASHRFRRDTGRSYPETTPAPMTVRESGSQGKRPIAREE